MALFAYDKVNNEMTDLSNNKKSFYTYIFKIRLLNGTNSNEEIINEIKK